MVPFHMFPVETVNIETIQLRSNGVKLKLKVTSCLEGDSKLVWLIMEKNSVGLNLSASASEISPRLVGNSPWPEMDDDFEYS